MQGEVFILAEECQDPFDAHDAAHVYRAHEGFKARVIPNKKSGDFRVYVGPERRVQEYCHLRWCPYNEAGKPGEFYEPSDINRAMIRKRKGA